MDSQDSVSSSDLKTRSRPVGVWVLCLLNLWLGIVAIAGVVMFHVVPEAREAVELGTFATALSLAIGLGLVVTSVLAWLGHPLWRDAMLYIVSVHLVFTIWNATAFLYGDLPSELPSSYSSRLWAVIIRSLAFLAANWWYFKSSRSRAFYARSQRPGLLTLGRTDGPSAPWQD